MCVGAAPGPPTPCPILPRNRSNVDKVIVQCLMKWPTLFVVDHDMSYTSPFHLLVHTPTHPHTPTHTHRWLST